MRPREVRRCQVTRESTNVKLPTATRENYFRTRSRHTVDQRRRNDEITVLLEKSSTRYVSEKAAYFLISSRGPRSHDDDVRSVT